MKKQFVLTALIALAAGVSPIHAISFAAHLPQSDFKKFSITQVQEPIESSIVSRMAFKSSREIRMEPIKILSVETTSNPSGLSFEIINRNEMSARLFSFDKSVLGKGISAEMLNERLNLLNKTTPKIQEFEVVQNATNVENSEAPFFLNRQSLLIKYAFNRKNTDETFTRVERSEYWILNDGTFYVVSHEAPLEEVSAFEKTIKNTLKALYFAGS